MADGEIDFRTLYLLLLENFGMLNMSIYDISIIIAA
jgi:hypothetical protein